MKKQYYSILLIIFSYIFVCSCDFDSASQNSSASLTLSGALNSAPSSSIITHNFAKPYLDVSYGIDGPTEVAGAPTSITLTVYELYVSAHTNCTEPILVSNTEKTVDLASSSAELFNGNIDPGTYPCIILKLNDVMHFRPNSVAQAAFPGVCSTSVDSTFDIYRTDSGEGENYWKDILGNSILPTGTPASPSNDHVYIFASTDISAAINGPLAIHSNQGSNLTGALQVPGNTTFTITIPENAISNNNGHCWLEELGLGFN